LPLTAVLEFATGGATHGDRELVRLRIVDSRRTPETCFAGRAVPLAADLTAPLAYTWSRSRAALLGRQGLRGGPEVARLHGVRLLEPYDPRRIPVVLVHGLGSSPQAWRNLANEILGADALRERFQVWLYAYPTADPFVVAAARFRADLRASLDALGVRGDPGIVVVGHSMGGLLAKSLVVDSGPRLWNAAFAAPADRLGLDAADRAALESALVLKPWPEVRRVVFLATPHGGSELADAWWARLVQTLIRPTPLVTAAFVPDAAPGAAASAPRADEWRASVGETSVAALSPRRPLLRAFRALPIDAVPFHTIYGNLPMGRDRHGDGVVLAEDARLDGAASELALPVRHGEFDTPPVVDELLRILEAHAAATEAPARVQTCAQRLAIAGE
jgi:pimeloyl-ACP methyl ester carboxylesterase